MNTIMNGPTKPHPRQSRRVGRKPGVTTFVDIVVFLKVAHITFDVHVNICDYDNMFT